MRTTAAAKGVRASGPRGVRRGAQPLECPHSFLLPPTCAVYLAAINMFASLTPRYLEEVTMKRYTAFFGITLATLALAAHPAQAGISVSIMPSSSMVQVNDTFTVDILADITSIDAIVGWGMDLSFDSLILSHNPLTDVVIGPSFNAAPTLDGDGLAGLLPFSPPPITGVSGDDVLLATLTFQATQTGASALLGGFTLGDLTEGFVQLGGGQVDVAFDGGLVQVIPAPTAALLGMIGLAGIAITKRHAVQTVTR